MLNTIDLEKVLFLDIETVSRFSDWTNVSHSEQDHWKKKAAYFLRQKTGDINDEDWANVYNEKAAIFAEFGKVIVISCGFIAMTEGKLQMRIKSFYKESEKELLEDFAKLISLHFNIPKVHYLCGHNIREFDIPYICRRMTVHGIPLPDMINLSGKRPWEAKHILDTLELWRFGDFKNFTSLSLLAHTLGIASPKDDIDGSQVGNVYWLDKDLKRIKKYCEKDVITVAQVGLKLSGRDLLKEEQIIISE